MDTPTDLDVRPATTSDRPFLAEMLAEAAAWRDGVHRPVADVIAPEEIAHHLPIDWPRPGEAGVVATRDGTDVGATWWTRFDTDDPGYGFVAEDVPEVTIGVVTDQRGHGVGTRLLTALCTVADRLDLPALSLSVEPDNPAVSLYQRHGFATVTHGDALTMLRPRRDRDT